MWIAIADRAEVLSLVWGELTDDYAATGWTQPGIWSGKHSGKRL